MTDPFSLSVGIITLFKETYLVANYIYKTVNSAKNSEEERRNVASKMRWELLVFQSFGRYFSNSKGVVVRDVELDERWLSEILDTLEGLRVDFADYTRRAGQEDSEYKAWYNNDEDSTTLIDIDIDNAVPPVAEPSLLAKFPQLWHDSKAKIRQVGVASGWALWDRRRLEATVEKFQKRNAKLKEVLQLATATQQLGTSDALRTLLNSEDAKTLGLTAHAEIRQLVAKPERSVDYTLKNVVLVADDELATIQMGTCETSAGKGNKTTENVLVEFKDFPPTLGGLEHSEIVKNQSSIKSRVHDLAGLLSSSGSNDLGTLPFKGIVEQTGKSRHAFVFYFPAEAIVHNPESLHSFIEASSSTQQWPLAARFKIAQNIAKSIGAFHADGWVHKGVRSESIVFFRRRSDSRLLSEFPYLVGFEYSRPESGSTLLLRDNNEEKNLYRHPEIQDVARSSFSKSDDIYSLGVVLLEIALWQTARSMLENLKSTLKRKKVEYGAINATGLQKMYIERTKKRVAHLMGTSFQNAVLACLESKYKDQIHRQDFPILFHDEVTQELSAGRVA